MAKKGKITVKVTGTVKRTVRVEHRQQVQYTPQIEYTQAQTPQVSTAPVQKALNDFKHEVNAAQRKLNAATRKRSIPSGVYSEPVENLFYALDERRKTEADEAAAMYDVFVSHASEDKADFVGPLVEKLQDAGICVWYDALEMKWGKSLREQIDNGIKRSKFAIVVLSKHFFAKDWPKRELDGILAKESVSGSAPLPIWHNITQKEMYDFSPTLSGVFAYSTTTHTVDDICQAFQLLLEESA